MNGRTLSVTLVTTVLLAAASGAQAGTTLNAVKERGYIKCGVSDGLPGFSFADEKGKFSGIDVDVCHGIASAVFGDSTKVKFTPLTAKERFTALQTGEILSLIHIEMFIRDSNPLSSNRSRNSSIRRRSNASMVSRIGIR